MGSAVGYGSQGAGCCLIFCFFLACFATVSPYWIWRYSYTSIGWAMTSTFGSGAYVLSSSSAHVPCYGWYSYCYVSTQWNHLENFNTSGMCDYLYEEVGQYGFCNGGVNGTIQLPSEIASIQGLSITTTIASFISGILACVAPAGAGSKGGFCAGLFSALTLACSCAAFSVAASYSWYQTFWENGYLPAISQGKDCNNNTEFCAISIGPHSMGWGPAFWSMVMVFVISLFTTVSICVVSKDLDNDDELEGFYGAGSGAYNNDFSEPLKP